MNLEGTIHCDGPDCEVHHELDVPELPDNGLERWIVRKLIPKVRTCLRKGGGLKKESEVESAGSFLVGCRGSLFAVHSDLQIECSHTNYNAVGSGHNFAMGSLHATAKLALPPRDRLRLAVEPAEAFDPHVRRPFRMETA